MRDQMESEAHRKRDVPLLRLDPSLPLPLSELGHREERHIPAALRRIDLISTEESIHRLDTIPMSAIRLGASDRQQQYLLISTMIEDITCRDTLHLPAVASERQAQVVRRQMITNAAGGVVAAGTGDIIFAVLRYVTNVIMTNLLSQSIYGIYITVYTAATIAGYVGTLGLDGTIARFLSIYRANGERSLAAGIIRFVVLMTLCSGLLCSMMFYLSSTVLAHLVYHQDAYTLPLREIALLVPLISLQLVLANGLMALKAIKWKVYTDRLIQPVITLICIIVFYLLGLRLEALILATICGFLASVITGYVLIRKASKELASKTLSRFEVKKWLHFALPMSFNSIIQSLLGSTDVLFLAAFATTAQIGLYAASERVSTFILMPLFALNVIFAPLIAEFYARKEHKQLVNMSKLVTKWSFSLSLPVFLCFCVFHEAILSIFSKGYTAAGAVLIILSFGNLIDAGVGSVGYLLVMTGHARIILANTVVAIMLNIGLAFLLIPRFNIVGAALATTLTVISVNLVATVEVFWLLKFLTFRWDMLKSIIAGGVASITGWVLVHFIHGGYGYQAVFGLIGLVFPFLLVYGLMLALLRLSKEDMMVFDALRAKVSKR